MGWDIPDWKSKNQGLELVPLAQAPGTEQGRAFIAAPPIQISSQASSIVHIVLWLALVDRGEVQPQSRF